MSTIRKIVISLDADERAALSQLAERERRNPRTQAALLIRRELERIGLLAAEMGITIRPGKAGEIIRDER